MRATVRRPLSRGSRQEPSRGTSVSATARHAVQQLDALVHAKHRKAAGAGGGVDPAVIMDRTLGRNGLITPAVTPAASRRVPNV